MARKRQVEMSSGQIINYKNLITTLPLDKLIGGLLEDDGKDEGIENMRRAMEPGLVYSSTIIIGLGVRGVRPDRIGDKCT